MVFGRVIRGYEETIKRIADVPTDDRDRPAVPVLISHCGELELRKPPAPVKRASEQTASEPESNSEVERSRKHSRRRRSDSADGDRKRKKSRKDKTHKSSKNKHQEEVPEPAGPRKETEEEYDARLEREENERIAERKRRELAALHERLKQQDSHNASANGGIRYKGRGQMKFVDPESTHYRREH